MWQLQELGDYFDVNVVAFVWLLFAGLQHFVTDRQLLARFQAYLNSRLIHRKYFVQHEMYVLKRELYLKYMLIWRDSIDTDNVADEEVPFVIIGLNGLKSEYDNLANKDSWQRNVTSARWDILGYNKHTHTTDAKQDEAPLWICPGENVPPPLFVLFLKFQTSNS